MTPATPPASRSRPRAGRGRLSPPEWTRVGGMAATIVALNVVGWGLLIAATRHHLQLSRNDIFGIGTGVLAYTLGMRHAFDADHIAAIDNTTRKLMAEGKRPAERRLLLLPRPLDDRLRAGRAAAASASAPSAARSRTAARSLHRITTSVGTGVSGLFLYLIAALNLVDPGLASCASSVEMRGAASTRRSSSASSTSAGS